MQSPLYIDRIERKYQVGISDSGVAGLWRELSSFLPRYGLDAVQEITSVGSVYFDNRAHDLLRYSLLIERANLHLRLRAYEYYGRPLEPISECWVEVKTKKEELRRKKRFRLKKESLIDFFEGKDVGGQVLDHNREDADPEVIRNLCRETQETVLTLGLKPILLVTYKRVAFQNGSDRLSLDWDIQYYHVGTNAYFYDTWKYLTERPVGKAEKTFLELKYPEGDFPSYSADLERRYPLWERTYSKFVEGMGFLFQGPLRYHREGDSFLQMIETYLGDRKHPLR